MSILAVLFFTVSIIWRDVSSKGTVLDFLSCGFEEDCGLYQADDDDFDWIGNSNSPLGKGAFVYVLGTQGKPGDKAMLITESPFSVGEKCLTISINMEGDGVITLDAGSNTLATFDRDTGGEWTDKTVDIALGQLDNRKLSVVAKLGFNSGIGSNSHIAVDNLIVTEGGCPRQTSSRELTKRGWWWRRRRG